MMLIPKHTHLEVMNDGPSTAAGEAAVAERYGPQDEERMRWLNAQVLKERCRCCHRRLTERQARETPGVCASPICQRELKERDTRCP